MFGGFRATLRRLELVTHSMLKYGTCMREWNLFEDGELLTSLWKVTPKYWSTYLHGDITLVEPDITLVEPPPFNIDLLIIVLCTFFFYVLTLEIPIDLKSISSLIYPQFACLQRIMLSTHKTKESDTISENRFAIVWFDTILHSFILQPSN
jgi:hypothetical protein